MISDSTMTQSGSGADWLLTPEELRSLRATRRLFLLGFIAAVLLALGMVVLAMGIAVRQLRDFVLLGGLLLGFVALVAVAAWCAGRAGILGQDIRGGRAEVHWGRVTQVWGRLHVVEVEGMLFPLQMTPVPVLRPGERVRLRYALRSRITLGVHTLRELVAEERRAGRSPCPAALAELGMEMGPLEMANPRD
jgi:hypothetical protein